jgi:hypothetical protein
MLVGLGTVALATIVADLAGNDATRWFSRRVFAVMVLLELQVADTVGGVANWTVQALATLL